MKTAKALVLLIPLLMIACATTGPKNASEYEKGRLMGEEYAKKDIPHLDCSKTKIRLDAVDKARTYSDMLTGQGKSKDFMDGFYYGYEEYYFNEGIEVRCGE